MLPRELVFARCSTSHGRCTAPPPVTGRKRMRSCNISIGCAAERQPTFNGDACAATVCAVWHVPCDDARAARHRDRWQRRIAGAAQNDIEISGYRIEPQDRGGSCRTQVASYRRHERATGSLRQTASLLAGCRAGEARCGWRMALHAAGRRASRKRAHARGKRILHNRSAALSTEPTRAVTVRAYCERVHRG